MIVAISGYDQTNIYASIKQISPAHWLVMQLFFCLGGEHPFIAPTCAHGTLAVFLIQLRRDMNEAVTCRTYVLPKLKSAGWEDETISEQMVFKSASGEELRRRRTLSSSLSVTSGTPSVLDRAFKGELR